MINDTISNMLTIIRNANMVKHQIVKIPYTKISFEICRILKEEGFIEDFKTYSKNKKNYLLLSLKYFGKTQQPVITKIKRISKPGLRIYSTSKNLPKVINNLGIAIISTSKGIMTNFNAKKYRIGGEILCYIW